MSKKAARKADVAPANVTPETVTPATPVAETPTQDNQVTVQDLVAVVKFLEELAKMHRLSEFEIAAIKPSFDRIVGFLSQHEQTMQNAQPSGEPITQTQEELLDLPKSSGKKKANKKK